MPLKPLPYREVKRKLLYHPPGKHYFGRVGITLTFSPPL